MRSLHIVEMCLSLALAAAAIPANADNSIITVQPDANAQAELGQILGSALQVKQIARLAVIVKCNHYHLIEVTYRNGSIKVLDDPRAPGGRNEPMDRDRLETLATTLPGFTWGELPCEEWGSYYDPSVDKKWRIGMCAMNSRTGAPPALTHWTDVQLADIDADSFLTAKVSMMRSWWGVKIVQELGPMFIPGDDYEK